MQHRIATMILSIIKKEEKEAKKRSEEERRGKGKGILPCRLTIYPIPILPPYLPNLLHIIHPYIHARYPILILEASIPIK